MYKIINYYTGKTLVLNGGTKLNGFKTKAEANETLNAYHKKGLEETTHNWLCYIKKYENS